jgi:hypothetical protein
LRAVSRYTAAHAGFEHLFDDTAGRSGSAEVDLAGTQRLIDGYGLQFSFVP